MEIPCGFMSENTREHGCLALNIEKKKKKKTNERIVAGTVEEKNIVVVVEL